MPEIAYDRYYRYQDLTSILEAFAIEFPSLVKLESIGKSHEGRDIWLATVTDFEKGKPEDKPAFWCDGNIHASEVSASTTVLKILDLLTKHAGDTAYQATKGDILNFSRLLAERTFYLVPRLCPDGAEWALEVPPRVIRSSTRKYPFEEEDVYGLERKDVDGDGRILNMRVKDPNGPWKISAEHPRLLQKRAPGESGGTYYRVFPEGEFHNFDGMTMRSRRMPQGLDMNRNFPSAWRPESEQHGAGPYPTSEPEIRAAVDAISKRPNICGAICFHTFSGVHLRPPSRIPDDELPAEDLWAFKELGSVGTRMTGYPAISNYHEFRYHPKEVITGVFDDWMFHQLGVYAWTTEIWSPQRQAGITDYKYIDWFRDHPFEDDVKMLKWSDEKLGGEGYVDWFEFDHPQLGKVEIGGWNAHFAFRNPPPQFLETEITPLAEWAIWHAGCGPRLELRELRIEGNRIRIAVQNAGWLPTSVTKLAAEKKYVRGVQGEISGPPGNEWLIAGKLRQEAGQLRGYSDVAVGGFGWHMDETDDVAIFEWVVKPGTYRLACWHDRAGRVSVEATVV